MQFCAFLGFVHLQAFPTGSVKIQPRCKNQTYAPLDLSLLAAEGEHRPDGRQHLLCHGSSFGVRRLLFAGEARHHLIEPTQSYGLLCRDAEREMGTETFTLGCTHLAEKRGRDAQHWAHRQDDQGEFPAFGEADDEGGDEGGVSLDQTPDLVADSLLDLVDVTAQ